MSLQYDLPKNCKYSKTHEYVRLEADNSVTIGVTDFAQKQLGSIVYVELPETESEFNAGESFGVIESVEATEDLYMVVSGTVIDVNKELEEMPELVNDDPYGKGWMIRVKPLNLEEEMGKLMDSDGYMKYIKTLEERA
ncbi:MAG: glycine cleavage system protein GcvH [Candidatus Wukongarchaeota archaeon]|nr:glycine cleavage system protein GcvH [Candidatus Wukongarchaeota archaeon]MDO8128656.1 glycine cleavage system protein GcvH [Candidatus Wukongarchaeota archaeon]